jgi:hypothetical protein
VEVLGAGLHDVSLIPAPVEVTGVVLDRPQRFTEHDRREVPRLLDPGWADLGML